MRSVFAPDQAASLFRRWSSPWGIAGGWAIDLHIGTSTRPHEDVDIALLREDADTVHELLAGWDLRVAHDGELTPWLVGTALPLDRHAVWCRPSTKDPWAFELLFNDHMDGRWLFRRDHSISRPLDDSFCGTSAGIPILHPAIVLLFKAKSLRERDQADFSKSMPTLSQDDRAWLGQSIEQAHPGHSWARILS